MACWPCYICTFDNHEDLLSCEICGTKRATDTAISPSANSALAQHTTQPPQRQHSLGIFRQASGNSPDICWLCLDTESLVGRDVGNVRLACHCAFHYSCLVRYIKNELKDANSVRAADGILCPNAKPQIDACEYSGNYHVTAIYKQSSTVFWSNFYYVL
jgi:hypothetical protein